MKRVLSKANERYIRKHYLTMSDKEIGAHMNVNKDTIGSCRRRLGLQVDDELSRQRRKDARQAAYDKVEHLHDDYIRDNYLTLVPQRMADTIGRSEVYVKGRMQKMSLAVPKEIVEQRKADSRIKKGNVPLNKGRRMEDWMSDEGIQRSATTRFSKGGLPHNTRSDGERSIRNDNSGVPYEFQRVSKAKWRHLQIINWEAQNGPIPAGHILVCKDGDTLNCAAENWEPITRAEHASRNRNPKKLGETLKKMYAAGLIDNPLVNMHDAAVASWLFPRNRELAQEALKRPDLIQLKRTQITLKRAIRNELKGQSNTGAE